MEFDGTKFHNYTRPFIPQNGRSFYLKRIRSSQERSCICITCFTGPKPAKIQKCFAKFMNCSTKIFIFTPPTPPTQGPSILLILIFCYHSIELTTNNDFQGIGNGLPLGAVVTTPEIANVMTQKIQFNTFGGNPVCSAGGHAVLRVLDKENRQKHCAHVGSHLIGRLRELQQRHESNCPLTLHLKNKTVKNIFTYFG